MKEKLKELTKDTAIYGISTMLGRFLNFILVPFYTNVFSPADYGVVILIYSYIALFNIIFIYGMDAAFLKYSAFKDIGDEKDNFSTPYFSVLLTSIFIGGLIIFLQKPIAEFVELKSNLNYIITITAIILVVDANVVIPFLKLRLEKKAKLFSLIKITSIVFNIILNAFLILKLKWGIEAIFISNLAASVLSFLLLTPTLLKNIKFSFHKVLFKRLLKFGLPYLPAGLGMMLVQVIDAPILEKLTDVDTVGIYKANYKLGIFMMLFVNMFQYAWQPFFLTTAKEEKENYQTVYAKVDGAVAAPTAGLHFTTKLLEKIEKKGIHIVPVILLAYLFNGLYVVFSAGIYIEEKSIYAPVVAGLGAVTNIVANYILIPQLNIMGAALATLLSYIIMASGYYIVTQKFYKINYDYLKLAKITIAVTFVGTVYYLLMFGGFLLIYYKIILAIIFIAYIFMQVFEKSEMNFIKTKLLRR